MSERPPTTPVLGYENPRDAAAAQVVQTPDGGVSITIPTRRSASRFVGACVQADFLVLLVAPLLWMIFSVFATRKPRAILSLTPDKLIVTDWNDDGLGIFAHTRVWARAAVGELRRNRYDRGLWLTIVGRDSMTLLSDVPDDALVAVCEALGAARERLAASGTA